MTAAPCGTYRGHRQHRRRGERACLACCFALGDYNRAYRLRTGRIAGVTVSARVLGLLLSGDPDALRRAVAELGQRTVDAALVVAARDDTKVAS